MVTFDITNKATFDAIAIWVEAIEKNASADIQKVLVGNKADLEHMRAVQTDEAKELADKYKMDYFETSALTGDNVEEAFTKLFTLSIPKPAPEPAPQKNDDKFEKESHKLTRQSQINTKSKALGEAMNSE